MLHFLLLSFEMNH